MGIHCTTCEQRTQTNSSFLLSQLRLNFYMHQCWCCHLLTPSGRKEYLVHLVCFSFSPRPLLQRKLQSNTGQPQRNYPELHDRRTPQPHPWHPSLTANAVPNRLWNNNLLPHSDQPCSGTARYLPLPWREGSKGCSDSSNSEQTQSSGTRQPLHRLSWDKQAAAVT